MDARFFWDIKSWRGQWYVNSGVRLFADIRARGFRKGDRTPQAGRSPVPPRRPVVEIQGKPAAGNTYHGVFPPPSLCARVPFPFLVFSLFLVFFLFFL